MAKRNVRKHSVQRSAGHHRTGDNDHEGAAAVTCYVGRRLHGGATAAVRPQRQHRGIKHFVSRLACLAEELDERHAGRGARALWHACSGCNEQRTPCCARHGAGARRCKEHSGWQRQATASSRLGALPGSGTTRRRDGQRRQRDATQEHRAAKHSDEAKAPKTKRTRPIGSYSFCILAHMRVTLRELRSAQVLSFAVGALVLRVASCCIAFHALLSQQGWFVNGQARDGARDSGKASGPACRKR